MIPRMFETLPVRPVSHNGRISKRVYASTGELPGITQIARAVFPVGETAPAHSHADMWEVFICESGEAEMKIGHSLHRMQSGDCLIVEPSEVHELSNTGKEEMVVTVIGIVKVGESGSDFARPRPGG